MSTTTDIRSAVEAANDERVRRVEILISNILRIGVVTSLAFIVFGIVLSFIHHPEYLSSPDAQQQLVRPDALFAHTLPDVFAGVAAFRGRAIATLGLLLLIATPVVRVAVSIFAFIYQKDRTFVIITSVVLALLLLSFILGKSE